MRYLVTTDPGLEAIVAEELAASQPSAVAETRPYGQPGQLRIEHSTLEDLLRLRTIHHVLEIRGECDARFPDEVDAALAGVEFPELRDAASFRVTSKLHGRDAGEKQAVQRAAGAVLQRRYGTPVDLENFEVEVRVDRYETRAVVGIQRTKKSLGNRLQRARALRSALKPTVAAAMLRLCGANEGEGVLIDPLCGAGTIPVEAAQINPRLQVLASDWDPQTVDVARGTIANHRLSIEVQAADARTLGDDSPAAFDWIVSDPPHGMRQARRTSTAGLYRALLASFEKAIRPSGAIALVVVKYRAFLAALERSALQVSDECTVDLGSVGARIYVLRRER